MVWEELSAEGWLGTSATQRPAHSIIVPHCTIADPNSVSTLSLMPHTDKYKGIVEQFTNKWMHSKPLPQIERIFKIHPEASILKRYEEYKATVECCYGPFKGRSFPGGTRTMEVGNEQRRFHGTLAKCAIGTTNSQNTLCNESNCSVCGIIRTSFKKSFSGTRHTLERYGIGIYFSSTSSKSDDYCGDGFPYGGARYKTMFLCKVVVGKVTKPMTNLVTLTSPPDGYNAVIGEPGRGSIKYDEVVVYENAACYPAYLLVYKA
ncbi:ADP-ribosylation [Jimgerdemannia flammicorona]|uniref:ADP-ribosylation n=1 Tax=Jimgerdemannia flammicorona TaxID=994334 RepID=A0A433DIL3_9FUNG|nr:ADP-ribosylation [Jimgerdemannia flammicorona]